MASFSEWSNNKKKNEGTRAATPKAKTFSAWSNQKLGKTDTQNNYTSKNAGFTRSGKSRDEYDSSVRQNYAARAAASDKLTESEYNRSGAMQQKYGSYQNYLVGATADGKYYTQPKLGAEMERKYNTVSVYETNAKQKAQELQTANETAGSLYTKLNELGGKLPELQQYASSSAIASGILQQMQTEYADTLKQYEEATKAVDAAYAAYEPAWNQYKQAAEDYEAYRTEQENLFNNWKSTIRTDEDAINNDLTAAQANVEQLQAQQEELYKQAQVLMNKVSNRRGGMSQMMEWSQQAQALRTQAQAMNSQIAEAQGTVDLLQEELDWKKYYQYADVAADNNALGQYGKGNIDLYNRPQYQNPDGSISTVDSASYNIDGKEVLLPTVWMKDGKAYHSHDDDEIVQHYFDTGEYLGKFDTPEEANAYGEQLHRAQDFYYGSQYKSTATGEEPVYNAWSNMYTNTGFADVNYDIINRNEEAKGRQGVNNVSTNASFLGLDNSERGQMTDEEIAIFNYLYAQDAANGDAEHTTAYAYIDYLTNDLTYRQRQKDEEQWASYAKESPVGSSVFSVLESPLKGLSYIGQLADYMDDGKIDQNAGYNKFSYINSAIRDEVSETIEQSGKWGQAGSFLYQTGMSMGDFLLNTAITGGFTGGGALSEGMSLAIMGTGAAADATIAAKDRGLTDTQAFTLGTIAGAAEVFTEKFSIDALLKGKWEDGAIKYILKNAFTEGAEEVGSDFINLFADILVAKDKSEWQQTIDAYMADGKTEGEAFGLAVAQQAAEMGLDFLGGALSGGTMASVGAGIGTVQRNAGYQQTGSTLRKMGSEMVNNIIETAETLDQNSEAYKLGQELKAKLEKGKTLTDTEIGRLFAETARMLQNTEQTTGQTETTQQTNGIVLPTAEETGGVVLPTADTQSTQAEPATAETRTEPETTWRSPDTLPTAEEAETQQRAARAETETERTGILAGVDEDTIAKVQRISNIVGREVVFFDEGADAAGGVRNGSYDPSNGIIYINARSQNPVAQIISHELTHSIETSGQYNDLQKLVLNRIRQTGGDLQAIRQQKAELYARHGETDIDVDSEIVAEYVEKYLLTDEQTIRNMVQQNRTLGQRILQFINELLAKLGNSNAQERAFLTKARSYYQSALQETQSSFTTQTQERTYTQAQKMDNLRERMANGEISDEDAEAAFNEMYDPELDMRQGLGRLQHSYGGENANGANLESLREAQAMQEAGADMESIRKATGWHEGMDGKWRFEIDDSGMTYHRGGDAAFSRSHPDYAEYQKLMRKWMTGDVTAEEETRLQQLDEIWGREYGRLSERVESGDARLEDILDHEGLFRAYPQLRRTKVEFADLPKNTMGSYSPSQNLITLSNELRNAPESTLVHEIQHAIQNAEGFAKGSNRQYWEEKLTSGDEIQSKGFQDAREKLIQFQLDEANEEALALKDRLEKAEAQDDDLAEYDRLWEEAEQRGLDGKINEYYELRENYYTQMNRPGNSVPSELYYNTAGEIEARDVSKRRELTAEERRETAPDYGSEDTVFADGGDGYAMSQSEQDSVKEQLREHQDALNNMKAVATIRDNGWRGMSTGAFRQKIINDLKKTGYRVDNPSIGVIDFDEKLLNRSLNYIQTDAEAAAYQALPQVLKRGIEISGHDNHKGRDYETLTIAAPVELNGQRGNMAVVVMKTKGNRYKVHRILTPEGKAFALPEMTNAEPNTVGTVTSGSQSLGGSAPAISSASGASVAENGLPVKKRFSIDEPVEQTKDFIAVHNKDWSVIRDAALNWGGIPSPSVAIVDAREGHTKYGDTSVVYPRSTIDPEADPRNRVYGGDAWTPTKDNALVEREVNYEARRAFDENIKNLSSQFADGVFRGSSTLGKIGLENETRWEPKEIADKLANHPEVQAAYLQSEGKSLEPVRRDKQFDRFFSNATIRRYLDTVGEQEVARLAVKLMTGERLTAEEMKPAEQAIREVYAEEHANFLNRRPESKEKRIDYYMKDNVFPNRVENFIRSAQEFYESGGSAGEIDKEATAAKMMEMIAPGGSWNDALRTVKDWVQPQLEGLLGELGIYNGKDVVTDSGRRSFAETHWDYTAENIVKAMNMAADKGANMYGVTPETLAATATREYKTVDEMHADEARLRTVSEEEHAKALRDLGIYLDRVVNDLMLTTMHKYDNSFEEEQNLSGIIAEAAKGKKTVAAVKEAFRKEGYNISDGHAKSILALIDRAANIPTGYYEAKAQRVVPFSEAAAIIAPTSAPAEEIAAVKAATGVEIIQYETGNEEQRKELVNGLEGVRFSVDDEETGMEPQEAAKPVKKEKKPRKPKTTKPVAESLPIIAKRDLKQNLLNLFSIPDGMRADMGSYVDQVAERMLKNGELSQKDRDEFFDQMYASGVMEVEADSFYQDMRQSIAGRRIYVPEGVKHEFSDDWNSFRKQAFAAGVLLTNNRSDNGIDTINMELADSLPGIFDAEELDSRTILERIVQMAEEGKAEKMSLAEYTAMLAEQEYVSEDEVLDNIERQMDWALRTFAEKAKLEIKLRDRTGVKIAQEREKASDREQRARQHEAVRRADERQRRKEMSQRQRENRELKELQQKTLKALQWLAKNQRRAPEELRSTWDEVLGDIDIFAVGAANEMNWSNKYGATWGDLAQMYKDAQTNDPNFLPSKELERIVHRLDDRKIADMDITALQDLYKAAVGLRTEFYNRNNVIGDEMNRLFADVYADSKTEIEDAPGGYSGGKLDKLMNLDQLSPMNVMQRMAGWNPESAFYSMAKQLEKGERDIRAYTVKANQLLRDFLTEHEDWVKKADGQGKDAIWYEIEVPELLELGMGDKPIFGNTVKVYMTPAQKVHLYLESKNYDNLRHMAGGRTFADRELYSQGKRREAFAQGKTVRLAPETVKALVRDLTPEEQELAGLLENYYNQFASKEINRVSNALYGYDKAVSKNYAPIYTNTNYTKSELGIYDATAEGVGNLKARQYSKNPSYNIGAFDAFERHIEQTARFVGMAVPARNWQTLLNWRENNSMADVISHKWGDEGLKYIQDIVQTLQGGAASKSDSVSTGIEKAFSNYISAVFGANPSIVLKQLGSIPLAAAWLDFGNFPSPGQVRSIDRSLIAKYTQELDWRTMGYSTPETKQLKDNPNWTQSNKTFAFLFGGDAITAMDGWAASVLWPWAENKVRREHPELEMGTQAQINSGSSPFYQKVAEEFNEAVARSQSTSDEIHQGTLRKSKNPVTRAFTMFKSDSSQTYNALRQRAGEAGYYKRKGDTEKQHKANKALAVAIIAAIGGYIWAQSIEFLMNLWKRKGKAYRDDEGDLTAESVAKEMVTGLVGDLAGIVVGGEEIADIIGNIIDGDSRWYGIDTPGLEQLSDIIEAVINGGKGTIRTLKDMADVVSNGGDLGEYLHRHGNDIAGGIKEMAAAAATYLPGLSVNNLEAYLLGTVRWAAPGLATAYEDALATADKSGLKGLTGSALQRRVNDILNNRRIETDDDTAAELARLYEAGHAKAVPVNTPGSITVDGESRELSAYQQQTYDKVWSGTIGDNLKELTTSEDFQAASDETKAKMLYSLYDYAGEKAKTVLFGDYEQDSFAASADEIIAAGASAADWAAWYGESSTLEPEEGKSGVSDAQKYALLQEKSYSDQIKQAIAGSIMGTDMETESGKPSQYAKMLQATQSGLGMDDYLMLKLDDAVDKYLDGIESGVDSETAFNMAQSLNELEPAEGKKNVTPAQKWRAAIDAADDTETQKAALKAVMTDDAWAKFEIADSFGIEPEAWVRLKETLPKYDTDGNGSYKNAEVEAAIDGMCGSGALLAPWDMETGGTELYLTNDEKAVLWQLFTGSKSTTGNPYSKSMARKVLEAKEAAKDGTEDAAEDSTLPPWMQ